MVAIGVGGDYLMDGRMKHCSKAISNRGWNLREMVHRLVGRDRGGSATVHQVRVTIKQARALLRLLRARTGERFFQRHNRVLRDAARGLSAYRDEQVLLATCAYLSNRRMSRSSLKFLAGARQRLEKILRERAKTSPRALARAQRVTQRVVVALSDAPQESDWHAAILGLWRTYRDARRMWRAARANRSAKDFHEWRKQVKHLHAQLEMLRPHQTRRQTKHLKRLGTRLGYLHDLHLLQTRLSPLAEKEMDRRQRERFQRFVNRRRAKLERRTLAEGRKCFAHAPKQWVKRRLGEDADGNLSQTRASR
jgi:hypothetical protein